MKSSENFSDASTGAYQSLPEQRSSTPSLHTYNLTHRQITIMQDRNLKFSSSVKGNRYLELKEQRQELAALYIKQGKMADPEQKYSLGSAPALVGECMDMCPLFERHEREFQTGGLDKSEKLPGTENVDHQKAVKRYRRSAAGDPPPLPCDVRPPKVLVVRLCLKN